MDDRKITTTFGALIASGWTEQDALDIVTVAAALRAENAILEHIAAPGQCLEDVRQALDL
jgi:hypothetical protein